MVSEEGLQAINIRTVARRCNVSVGSIYYYFSGKDELVLETIESVWRDIFNVDEQEATDLPFPEYVEWIFQSVKDGMVVGAKVPCVLSSRADSIDTKLNSIAIAALSA